MPSLSGPSAGTADPTLCDPDIQQTIESHYGFRLDQADPEQIKLLVSNSKKAGNDCFKKRRYRGNLKLSRYGARACSVPYLQSKLCVQMQSDGTARQ